MWKLFFRQMKINLHSTYLPSNQLDKLSRIKLCKTQFGMSAVHAGTSEDPWCKKCINRGNFEVENTILHCFYDCPSTKALIASTIAYFSPGSPFPEGKNVILTTKDPVFINLPKNELGSQLFSLIMDKILYNISQQIGKQTLPSPQKLIQTITSDLKSITKSRQSSKLGRLLVNSELLSHYTNFSITPPPLYRMIAVKQQ